MLSSWRDFRENSIRGPQRINESSYTLEITGLVSEPRNLNYPEVMSGYRSYEKVVTIDCVEGWSARILWKGILLDDLISDSRPLPVANTVIFHAYDGYTTSLPLEYITGNQIIMAYSMNNITLPPERGFPFQPAFDIIL